MPRAPYFVLVVCERLGVHVGQLCRLSTLCSGECGQQRTGIKPCLMKHVRYSGHQIYSSSTILCASTINHRLNEEKSAHWEAHQDHQTLHHREQIHMQLSPCVNRNETSLSNERPIKSTCFLDRKYRIMYSYNHASIVMGWFCPLRSLSEQTASSISSIKSHAATIAHRSWSNLLIHWEAYWINLFLPRFVSNHVQQHHASIRPRRLRPLRSPLNQLTYSTTSRVGTLVQLPSCVNCT